MAILYATIGGVLPRGAGGMDFLQGAADQGELGDRKGTKVGWSWGTHLF